MAVLLVDSNDDIFLNSIFELAKRIKGAKAKYITKEYSVDELFNKNPDMLSDIEAEYVTSIMHKEIDDGEEYTIEEAQFEMNKLFDKWKKSL